MILIYATYQTPRLTYIARFIFSAVLGIPVSFTSNVEEYKKYVLPKINYSSETLDGITIQPHHLLFKNGVELSVPEFINYQNIPALFPVKQPSSLPFDPLAAAFFMISRSEEYQPECVDHHNRVLPQASVAFKHQFIHLPVVDIWAYLLRKVIEEKYPHFSFPERKYKFIPTIDVDIAFAYKYRSSIRTISAALKAFFNGDIGDNRQRYHVLFKKLPDPYDTFKLIENWHQQYKLNPRYFFLVGQYGKFDKNLSPSNSAVKELIRQTSQAHAIGVHPSYRSNYNATSLQHEIKKLVNITGTNIFRSRQHFLMLRFPDTYKRLIEFGITEDYTMGYAQLPGFRAGTCTPFPFYDLTSETETSLMVYPFQVMDGTLNQYLRLSPLEAIDPISQLNNEVRKVNGTFISLWHNESLSEMRHWKNWRVVYEALLKIAS